MGQIKEWTYAAKAARALRNADRPARHPLKNARHERDPPPSPWRLHARGMDRDGRPQETRGRRHLRGSNSMIERIENFFAFPEPGSDRQIAGKSYQRGIGNIGAGSRRA